MLAKNIEDFTPYLKKGIKKVPTAFKTIREKRVGTRSFNVLEHIKELYNYIIQDFVDYYKEKDVRTRKLILNLLGCFVFCNVMILVNLVIFVII